MDEKRYFQWVVGDRKGEVVVFDSVVEEDGEIYVSFKDGARANQSFIAELNQTDLTGKLLAEVENPQNVWAFKEEWVGREEERWEQNAAGESVCVVPFIPGRKVIHLVPPKKARVESRFGSPVKSAQSESMVKDTHTTEVIEPKKVDAVNSSDPVWIMMEKAKKVESEVEMVLTMELPPRSLYNVAKESFDEGGEKALKYIIENLDISAIKDALMAGIKEMYEDQEENQIH